MRSLLLWFPLVLAAASECITVTGDKIVARDLAQAIPEFDSAPPEEVLSFAPIPGLTRNFKKSEIEMFAKRFQTSLREGSARDVCFLSAAAVLTEDQIRAAILPGIPWPVVSLKVMDFTHSLLPPGRLEFRANGLTHSSLNPPGTTVWHGRLLIDNGHSFPVWAKLKIVVAARIVVSSREIEKNQGITSGDVEYLDNAPFPTPEGVLVSVDEVSGQSALRKIVKGSPILKSDIELPKEVIQGQVVHVEAICGDAHLSFEGRAQNSGRRGDLITVLNPNGRSFRARVIDKARVEVRSFTGD